MGVFYSVFSTEGQRASSTIKYRLYLVTVDLPASKHSLNGCIFIGVFFVYNFISKFKFLFVKSANALYIQPYLSLEGC